VDAERISVAAAESIQSRGDASTAHLSVYGGVLLRRATAARQVRAGAATELADVAHAQLRLGHDRAVESTLLTMERAAPEWTAHQQLPRVLGGELLTRGCPSTRLREPAHRLNATRATRPS